MLNIHRIMGGVLLASFSFVVNAQTPPANPADGDQTSQLMRGQAYNGPAQPIPRGLDGKPDSPS